MNYNELKEYCRIGKFSVSSVAEDCGLTLDGLRKGLDNGGLSLRYVLPICNSLCISPNKFFGIENAGDTNYGAMNKNGKKQIINTNGGGEMQAAVQLLKDQLAKKDEQLAEKDKQIASLIGKL